MSHIYDNWERLVAATLKKQQLWELFHQQSRSSSVLSESPSFSSSSSFREVAVDFSRPDRAAAYWWELEEAVAKSEKLSRKLVSISDFGQPIDVESVVLSSAKFLGRGLFGSTYAAAMRNGVKIVVKRLNLVSVSDPEFRRHMDVVRNVQHDNVVPLRAYYSSTDERLMLYDHYNKSMYSLLHGQTGESRARVIWGTRLKIAIGAARGLAEIHRQNGGKLVHGNIKSSNIFLNAERYGCVSDLGLANIIEATLFSTARYYAPEVKNAQNVSQASDVYSFGILLFELLTRKSTEVVDLVKLVTSVKSKERAAKVFDADLLEHPIIEEQMVNVFRIGIKCVAKSQKKRPKISAVVKMLEDIWMKNHRNRVSFKLVFVEDANPTFNLDDMLEASDEGLGKGTFGTSHMTRLENGETIRVKRLSNVTVTSKDFQQHMEVIGRIRHKNVAQLRAYCYSKDEKFLVYDYYDWDNVSALLHGQTGENRAPVSWVTRLKIAIGAARGLAEIHRQNGGKLVHGHIKSSNIFLNSEHYGCVSDLGLAKIIEATFPSTARCYAPEVKNTQNVSQASDVYSFGILLLELLTRKSTVHVLGGPEVVDLVKLVTSVKSKERAAKVFDADLLTHPNIREQMVNMLQIGINCVAKSQKKRPKISAVVKMLEDIWMTNKGNRVSLVFVEDANPTFDLEDMLRASAEVLGKGTFGTSFKARLGNRKTIRGKRMRDVTVTSKDFQQHMEVLGRVRHDNVAQLKAYHYSNDEKLLVYDYYDQDSVSTLLHGNTGARKTHLDWETRLNIAVGAARGIAHIHRQDGEKLVHGNIKSSNIFLDVRRNSIVCDAGHARLTGPIRRSAMPIRGYCAPEVTDTRKVSQKSDVYSFGVVLLELVTGRPSEETNENGEVIPLAQWFLSKIDDDWVSEVFDADLLRYGDEERIEELLQIASVCVNTAPERRPTMSELVGMLEELNGIEPSTMEDLLQDTDPQPSLESRLEDVLEDMLPTLALLEV